MMYVNFMGVPYLMLVVTEKLPSCKGKHGRIRYIFFQDGCINKVVPYSLVSQSTFCCAVQYPVDITVTNGCCIDV